VRSYKTGENEIGNKANSNLWIEDTRDSRFEIRMHEKMMDKPPNEAKNAVSGDSLAEL